MRYDTVFLALGATYLLIGMVLGIAMGVAEDFAFASVHAHVNLVGWTSHAIFGLAHRGWPQLAQSRLAPLHFWLFVLAAPVFMIGVYLAASGRSHALVGIGALGLVIAVIVFCAMAWRLCRKEA